MASITALEIVNKVLRLQRDSDVTDFVSSKRSGAVLDSVNASIDDILHGRRWEFNVRHDGDLQLVPVKRYTDCTIGASSKKINCVGSVVIGQYLNNVISRFVLTGSSTFGNTALRLTNVTATITTTQATISIDWPGINGEDNVAGVMYVAEYLLPDTVLEVITADVQENPLVLTQIDPESRFEQMVRDAVEVGPPTIMAVGGMDYATGPDATEPFLRAIVWPLVETDQHVRYSYYYRHPHLVTPTDVIQGVPPEHISDIVRLTHSLLQSSVDMNAQEGLANERAARARSNDRANLTSAKRRHASRPLGGNTSNFDPERGFPGKTLGA